MIEEKGITSFKTLMAYKGALMIDDRQMIGWMKEVKQHGGLINVHATNGDMIDYLVQKNREEGKLLPLYHYLSQPEVTEATDHCPFMWEQKKMGEKDFSKIPNGHPAIENKMELLFSEGVNKGRITLNKYVEVARTNPAKNFGMFPRKGTIAVGKYGCLKMMSKGKLQNVQ